MNASVGPAAVTTPGSAIDWPNDAIEVGRVLDGWGIKGWIKVQPFAADGAALVAARRWFLKPPDSGKLKRPVVPGQIAAKMPPALNIQQSRLHGDWVVALAEGVADRTAAEALRGARVFVSRAGFPKTADDEFYWIDLIGLTVVNQQGEALGEVVGLIDTGPHSVLRVAPVAGAPEEDERLIPFVSAYVNDVDVAARRVTVDWGLDY
jgi:16S rRNA processing protein RimM